MQAYLMRKRDGTFQLKNRGYTGKLLKETFCRFDIVDEAIVFAEMYCHAKALGYTIMDDSVANKINNI
jgi:hypothetical protein